MGVNYDDKRFTEVEADKSKAMTDLENTYDGIIGNSDKKYQDLIDASKDYADEQTKLQNEKTDFAIEEINQQKAQAKKDYLKEQSGAYADWQKQSNPYGANAEQMASMGMSDTGYSESSQVRMYNQYQNRVAVAREAFTRAQLNYDNAITEARLQNSSALAEIAYKALQDELTLSLEAMQYKNTLVLQKSAEKRAIDSEYYNRWRDVLNQINTENAQAEQKRQFEAQMAENKRQFDASLAEEQRQFGILHSQSSGGSGSSGGSSSIKKSTSSSKSSISKAKEDKVKEIVKAETPSSKKESGTKDTGGNLTVDMESVLALGYGPISASKLNALVKQGVITEYEDNGKLKYKFKGPAFRGDFGVGSKKAF